MLIFTVIFMTALTLYGHRKGLIHMAVSIGSLIMTFILVDGILPYAEKIIMKSSFIREMMEGWNENLSSKLGEIEYSPLYELLGLEELCERTGEVLFEALVKGISFLFLFILIFLIIRIVAAILNIFAKLPIIYGLNQLGGAAIGFIEAIFVIWIIMVFVSFFPGGELCGQIMKQIYTSDFLLYIYKNNIIMRILTGVLSLAVF
ncbi:MAG: CvpA family protein [Eubacteriales bacterium]|nr:CvpA family protein [Eubacteriales bacterium]